MSKPKAGFTPEQKAKRYAQHRVWHANNPEKAAGYYQKYRTPELLQAKRDAERFRRYGLTPDQYAALLVSQQATCAICSTDTPGGRGGFHIDHCHSTQRVRGLLCTNCNTGLGKFKDNPAVLQTAIEYLRKELQ